MRQLNRFLIPFLLVTVLMTALPPSSYAQITQQMQNLAVANGNGTILNTNGMATATFTVICASCSGGTTVNFEGTTDGTNYVAMLGSLSGATTTATTTTSSTTQVWSFSVTSFLFVRARISAYSAGTVSVFGRSTPQGGGAGGGGGASGSITGTVGIDQSTLHANEIVCITGCSGGTSDTDDGSIAAAQSVGLTGALNMAYDGTVWRRLTTSAAGSGLATGLLSIQGNASGTPIPVTGTITAVTALTNALPAGSNNIGAVDIPNALPAGTNNIGKVDIPNALPAGSANIGAVNLQLAGSAAAVNTGLASGTTLRVVLATDQPALTNPLLMTLSGTNNVTSNSSNIATEASLAKLTQAQGSTSSGQSGTLMQCAVTTAAPTYTTAQTDPLSCDTAGSIRVSVVSGSTGNAAASATGSAVPAQGDYLGINVGGTLRGQTGQNPSGTIYTADIAGVGTAGTAAGGVLTVQGVASMTPILATLSGTNNINTVTTVTTISTVSSVSAVIAGTGATNLGKAVDNAAGATDTVVAAGCVRTDSLTTLTPASGDYVNCRTNSTGALWVQSSIIDAAIGAAIATNPVPAGCENQTSATTIADGQVGVLHCDTSQRLIVAGAGTAGTAAGGVLTIQGVASMTKLLVTPDANSAVNVAQINGVTTLVGNGPTGTGSQRVTIANDNTAFAVNATLSAETTKVIGTVRNVGNIGAAFDAATGAAPPANVVYVGGLTSGATGGFLTGIPICDSTFNINIVTATTTLAVTGVSGRHVRICEIDMLTNAANNVGIISGTGATCGTGSAAIVGTTAATGYNFAASSGIAIGSGIGMIKRTVATGDSVCIITSAATQLSGTISYTIY